MKSPLRPPYPSFFITLLLLSHHSLSLSLPIAITPPAPNITLTPFPPTTPLAYERNCIPKRTPFTACPSYYDCARAIFQLPDLVGEGSFHNGGPDDVFRLPVRKTQGTCAVRIELRHEGSSRQSASWHVIISRALSLNEVIAAASTHGCGNRTMPGLGQRWGSRRGCLSLWSMLGMGLEGRM